MEGLIPTADYPGADSSGKACLDFSDPHDVPARDPTPKELHPFDDGRQPEHVGGETMVGGFKPVIQLGFEIPKWWQVSWPSRFSSCERCLQTLNVSGQLQHARGRVSGRVRRPGEICETTFIQSPLTMSVAEFEEQGRRGTDVIGGRRDCGTDVIGGRRDCGTDVIGGRRDCVTGGMGVADSKTPHKVGRYDSLDGDANRHCNRKSGVRGTLSEFAERASIPGIKFMHATHTTWARAAWGVLLCVLLGLVAFHLYHLIAVFTSWQKVTQVSLGFDTLQFPAVTFCNVNPARASRLTLASKTLQELSSQTDPQALITKMTKAVVSSKGGVHRRDTHMELTKHGPHKRYPDLNVLVRARVGMTTKNHVADRSTRTDASEDACETLCNRSQWSHEVDPDSVVVSRDRRLRTTRADNARYKDARGLRVRRRLIKAKRATPMDIDMPVMIEDTVLEDPKRVTAHPTGPDHSAAHTAQPLLTTAPGVASGFKTTDPEDGGPSTAVLRGDVPLHGDLIAQIWGLATRPTTPTVTSEAPSINTAGSSHDGDLLDTTSVGLIKGGTAGTTVASASLVVQSEEPRKAMNFINDLDLETDNIRRKVQSELNEKDHVLFAEPSVTSNIADQFIYLFSLEDRPTRIKLGHQVEDMLVDCSFDGGRCFPDNFTLHTSSVFGNCFSMDYESLFARRSGPKYGLTLVIFLEHGEFLKGLTSGSGGHVVIHGKSTHPFPEEDGLAVPAGMEVKVALKLLRISRLGRPYGVCDDGAEFLRRYGTVYTRRTCQHVCEQNLVQQHCGCHDSQDEETHRLHNKELGHACATEKELRCMLATLRQYVTKELDCRCENPCSEVLYTKSISMRQWPTDEFSDVLVEALCASRSPEECAIYRKTDPRKFAQNFIKLNIYFEDLNYENITEIPSYEATQFFSDIGGALGLWMGLSVLAMTELAHLLSCLVVLLFKSMWERGGQSKLTVP